MAVVRLVVGYFKSTATWNKHHRISISLKIQDKINEFKILSLFIKVTKNIIMFYVCFMIMINMIVFKVAHIVIFIIVRFIYCSLFCFICLLSFMIILRIEIPIMVMRRRILESINKISQYACIQCFMFWSI